jgi:hypothetical protein
MIENQDREVAVRSRPPSGLLGRRDECDVLDRLVEAVRAGQSRAAVLCGEPGVGKSALLDYLVGRALGCRVARIVAVQSEMELALAGVHQLCAPMLDRDKALPRPQREALRIALGLSSGPAPDRFLVGLALLGLMAEVARERPLVCVVDDAQWLDGASAQTLAFVARRLGVESLAVVFASRWLPDMLAGLPELVVGGLHREDARALLDSVLSGPMDERVRDRIVAETRGNPLALRELPRGLTYAEPAGGFGLPHARTEQTERICQRQLAPLDPDTRRLLLVGAAEPLGDPVLLWRAAERLGIGVQAAAPAEAAGLFEVGAQARFRDPLLRSTIYRMAAPEDRRGAHRVLAEVTDPNTDPDRRAWHAAQAAARPDENIAGELESSAGRARALGGLGAAAAFLERAAELTVEPARRAKRALAAAQTRQQAGSVDAALRLLAVAEAGGLDELDRALAELLRAQLASTVNPSCETLPLLLRAAQQLEPLDSDLARDTYLEALWAAWLAGGARATEVAEAARNARPVSEPSRAVDLLLDGLATRFADGDLHAVPIIKHALRTFRSPDHPQEEEGLHGLWLACILAAHLWDEQAWEALASRQTRLAREAGALAALPLALNASIAVHACLGELRTAGSLAEELEAIIDATRIQLAPYGPLVLAAWRGRDPEAAELFKATNNEALRRGESVGTTAVQWASALLYHSLGR